MDIEHSIHMRQKKVFEKNAKTFSFAAKFLGKDTVRNIVPLYEFCRVIDDIADESEDPEHAKKKLTSIKTDIQNTQSEDAYIAQFIAFIQANTLDKRYIMDLLDGVISDCEQHIRIQKEEDLLKYCYHVAGTVGALMCPLLGVKKQQQNDARSAAINLGIAMQLTNIARDIKEDAQNNRVYLPQSWLSIDNAESLTSSPSSKQEGVQVACEKLLDTADYYYSQAKTGYAYLPLRSRITILIAGELYRAIGNKITKNQYQYWTGRHYLTTSEKTVKAFKSIGQMACRSFWVIPRKRYTNAKYPT